MPYLFNGKELDTETGLYYYGARYYDPRVSLWLNVDPLSGYNPIQETEHYIDGQHNGGIFNPMNHNTYGYTYQMGSKVILTQQVLEVIFKGNSKELEHMLNIN